MRDSQDLARRSSPPGRALPLAVLVTVETRSSEWRGTRRTAQARCGSLAGFECGGASHALRGRSAHCAAELTRSIHSVSLHGVRAKVSPDVSLWLAVETASKAFKVISRLWSISPTKAFYAGLSGFSLEESPHCNPHGL